MVTAEVTQSHRRTIDLGTRSLTPGQNRNARPRTLTDVTGPSSRNSTATRPTANGYGARRSFSGGPGGAPSAAGAAGASRPSLSSGPGRRTSIAGRASSDVPRPTRESIDRLSRPKNAPDYPYKGARRPSNVGAAAAGARRAASSSSPSASGIPKTRGAGVWAKGDAERSTTPRLNMGKPKPVRSFDSPGKESSFAEGDTGELSPQHSFVSVAELTGPLGSIQETQSPGSSLSSVGNGQQTPIEAPGSPETHGSAETGRHTQVRLLKLAASLTVFMNAYSVRHNRFC
jgi:hypothetical protein